MSSTTIWLSVLLAFLVGFALGAALAGISTHGMETALRRHLVNKELRRRVATGTGRDDLPIAPAAPAETQASAVPALLDPTVRERAIRTARHGIHPTTRPTKRRTAAMTAQRSVSGRKELTR